jgi:hypothetical protein
MQAYNLDLEVAIDDLTWRKFKTLLTGLGPNSAVVAVQSSRARDGSKSGMAHEKVVEFDMHDLAQEKAFIDMVVGKKRKRSKPAR